MSTFAKKLDSIIDAKLSETVGIEEMVCEAIAEPTEPIVLDMANSEQRKVGLASCRGPHLGWDEYQAGSNYQPPCYYQSDVPLGPPDEVGNPHSEQYGSVRPWSISEIIETVIAPNGMAMSVMRGHPFLRQKTNNLRNKQAVEALLTLAAEVVMKKIYKDEGRKGIKFQSYFFPWLKVGMVKGVSAGYGDEYRKARGLLRYWSNVLGSAANAVAGSARVVGEQDILPYYEAIMQGGESRGRSGAVGRIGVNDIDEVPGPSNEFGDFADRLKAIGTLAAEAIASLDAGQMREARRTVREFSSELREEEQERRSRGAHFDRLVSPDAQVTSFEVQGDEGGRTSERTDIADLGSDAAEQQRRADTMRRLIMLGRNGVMVDFMMAKGLVRQVKEKFASPPNKAEFSIEDVETSGRPSFNLRSPDGRVIETFDSHDEAVAYLNDFNPRTAMATDIFGLVDDIGEHYGKYADELQMNLRELAGALVSKDPSKLDAAIQELEMTEQFANEEIEKASAGKKGAAARAHMKPIIKALTPVEYRVMLRLFGISDYPERGTEQDPEVNEGEISDWAKNGYPQLRKFEVAQDLGISKVRVSQVSKTAFNKINDMSLAMYGDTGMQFEDAHHRPLLYEECIKAMAWFMMEFEYRDYIGGQVLLD